jgi:hypothetical protein
VVGLPVRIVNEIADRIRRIHRGIGNGLRRVGRDAIVFGVVAFRYVTRVVVCLIAVLTGAKNLFCFGCRNLVGLFRQVISKTLNPSIGRSLPRLPPTRDWPRLACH